MNCQELAVRVEATLNLSDYRDAIAELKSLLVGRCFKKVRMNFVVVVKVLRIVLDNYGDIEILSTVAVMRRDNLGATVYVDPRGTDSIESMYEFLRESVEIDEAEFKRIKAIVKFCDNRVKKDLESLQ